ncbi:glycosyltransferase [bacterium]|nr:glycosyltransferase [bacterium]
MSLPEGRILLVTNTLGRWGETNGVEYTYRSLIEQFRHAALPLDVVTYGPHDAVESEGGLRFFTHRPRLPLRIDPTLWVDPLFRFSGLAAHLAQESYTLVHSGTPDPLGWFGARLAARQGVPLVTVYHTLLDYYARVRVGRHLGPATGKLAERAMANILNRYYGRSDLILAPSAATRSHVARLFSPQVNVLSRGVDTAQFNPARRTRREGPVQALYVGRVAPEKNMQLLEKVFSARPKIALRVVGDGPYLSRMKRSLPQAEYSGRLTGEPLWRAFADADLFVFPSRSETFGNVVRQAMASALPVVVTDGPGVSEQVRDSVDGFVAADDQAFAAAVDRLAESRSLRIHMGWEARHSAMRFGWENVFHELLEQYEVALELCRARLAESAPTPARSAAQPGGALQASRAVGLRG